MKEGIKILGACQWRRPGERFWKDGNAVQFMNDAEGTVRVKDERGEDVYVPNTPECLRERK